MHVKKQQLELDMGQWTGSKLRKQYIKAVFCHLAYLTSIEYIMENAYLGSQAGIKIAGRNINSLRYADDTTLMAESKEGTKEPTDESERGERKNWLKTQHSKN